MARDPGARAVACARAGVRVALALALLCGVVAPAAAEATAAFDRLLRANVRDGLVDYPPFQQSEAFAGFVAGLSAPAKPPTRAARLAHSINAYNALAIQGILDGLSPSTLLGRVRYFKLREWPFDGGSISLYDLEHEVLRPLGEPRIHFAIVCASRSCPPLRPAAYTEADLEAQLDDQARRFINDPQRNRFDKASWTQVRPGRGLAQLRAGAGDPRLPADRGVAAAGVLRRRALSLAAQGARNGALSPAGRSSPPR